ncbi:Skt5p [Rhizophagus irregularis DAOM 197198w]|uniref:Skt5p n=2 Tax=Rhizophagus irregularis TaxID=588596 RepID=A0A015MIK6_RHIIW|nr:Skt5p [Rhizophagus irregularis DAOM 197198w]
MYNLAICYYNGEGTENNLENAFHWYQKSAENGYTNAMNNLAICYECGKGTEKNLEKTFYWYQKAAENGSEAVIFNLAKCYENGKGTEKNLEKTFYWYQKAAENGSEKAMNNLAICYECGKGTEKNLEKTFYWYQKAAENGSEKAMINLAICYENGKGIEKNLEKTLYWYQKAAENGNEIAMNNLAICYENGEGMEKNLEKAFYWFQKAAENGNGIAMNNLAICHKNGKGIEKNLEKAFYWYQKAAENGNGIAMNNLATCYYNGEGIEKNLEKAFYWYQKAAENGNKKAMNNLAICYECGKGTEKNLEKAFYWYQKAAENGNKKAMNNLAICYECGKGTEKNLEKTFYWYQKAAENGNEKAMNNLATCYYNGEGIEKNLEKAFYWYQKAAENGNEKAMNNLATCYYNGEGIEKNLEKAFYWYKKSAENGNEKAMNNLAICYCEKCTENYTDIGYKWCRPCQIDHLKKIFTNWTSGNEKIDEFIQEMQLKVNNPKDIIFEWIPYNQFNDIKEKCKTVYSASWKHGPLEYDSNNKMLARVQAREVTLKLCNSQNMIDEFLNKAKAYYKISQIYGISQESITKDYIMVLQEKCDERYCENCIKNYTDIEYKWCKQCQIDHLKKIFTNWTSGNEKIDEFIQEIQLKINNPKDIFEWIPYNQFNNIKEKCKTVYSASWKDGPLEYDSNNKMLARVQAREVTLKLCKSQNMINDFLNKVEVYVKIFNVYGITQYPDSKDYVMVLHQEEYVKGYCKTCIEEYTDMKHKRCKPCQIYFLKKIFTNWSGNEKIDEFIQEMQLKVNNPTDMLFEWISFNQFENIKKIGEGGFAKVYSAEWKNGPLHYDKEWKRGSCKQVALKCLIRDPHIK